MTSGSARARALGTVVIAVVCILAVAAVAALLAINFAVVRTMEGSRVVNKSAKGFEHVFVDARNWTLEDLLRHPDLVRDIERAGYGQELPHAEEYRRALQVRLKSAPDMSDRRWSRVKGHGGDRIR